MIALMHALEAIFATLRFVWQRLCVTLSILIKLRSTVIRCDFEHCAHFNYRSKVLFLRATNKKKCWTNEFIGVQSDSVESSLQNAIFRQFLFQTKIAHKCESFRWADTFTFSLICIIWYDGGKATFVVIIHKF